jgi:hypothetical protein
MIARATNPARARARAARPDTRARATLACLVVGGLVGVLAGCRAVPIEQQIARATPERPVVVPAPPPPPPPSAPAAPAIAAKPMDPEQAARLEAWRPPWWHEGAMIEAAGPGSTAAAGGSVRVCGHASADDLAEARRGAIEAACESLGTLEASLIAVAKPKRLDAIKLADGRFRAFVQVQLPREAAGAAGRP